MQSMMGQKRRGGRVGEDARVGGGDIFCQQGPCCTVLVHSAASLYLSAWASSAEMLTWAGASLNLFAVERAQRDLFRFARRYAS
jgi:hypothetical protein